MRSKVIQRGAASMLAAIVLVTSGPMVPPSNAIEPLHGPGPGGAGARVPDPVRFVPEAGRAEIHDSPEATIGFASRDLLTPRRPIVPRADGGVRTPAESNAAEPMASPAGQGLPGSSPLVAPIRSAAKPSPFGEPVERQPKGTSVLSLDGDLSTVSGVIAGAGTGALAGMVVCLDAAAGFPFCIASGVTAGDGSFTIVAAPGTYNVRSYDPTETHVPGYWSAGGFRAMQADAGIVTVTTVDVHGIDTTHPRFPYIRGTITDLDGSPLIGHTVIGGTNSRAVAGGDGAFAVKVWPNTQSRLRVDSTAAHRYGFYVAGGFATDESQATVIDVGSSDVAGIVFAVPTWPRVDGRVTDGSGAPVPNVGVRFGQGQTYLETLTGADGEYAIYLRGSGPWTAWLGGDGPWVQQAIPVAGDADTTLDVVLRRHPVIRGTVTDSRGGPAAGVTVDAWSATPGHVVSATTDAAGRYTIRYFYPTPSSIKLSFGDPTGTWVGGVLGPAGLTSDGGAAAPFSIAPDDELVVDVTMAPYIKVRGHVRLSDGSPVSGGAIWARSTTSTPPVEPSAPVGEDGSFELTVAPGSYVLAVPGGYYGQEGFAHHGGAVEPIVIGDEDREIEVVLPAGRAITGRVTSGGIGRGGVEVDVYLEGTPFTSGTTASDGTYAISVPPGAYLVGFYDAANRFAHGWYGPAGYTSDPMGAKLVGVGSADASAINVALPVSRRISGKVVDLQYGLAVPYAFVEAFVNGVFYSSQYAKADGTYRLPVAPGKVTLWVYDASMHNAPGWRTSTGLTAAYAAASAITVGTTDVTGVTVRTPEAMILTLSIGWVPAPGSRSSAEATTTAYANGAAVSFDLARSDGRRLLPLLKGTYRLWIDAADSPYRWTDGWSAGGTLTTDAAQATARSVVDRGDLTITIPTGETVSGRILDRHGLPVSGIDVQLFANGAYYVDRITNGGFFSFVAPPGTYRLAAIDPYGFHRAGWLGSAGYVASYSLARDIVVTSGTSLADLTMRVPMDGPPSAPSGVVAVPYHASALVTFTPAAGTLARPIIHHLVTASPGGRQCIATSSPACTVTGLTDGVGYTFTVTASSMVGSSAPSWPTGSVTPWPVPGAPGDVTVSPSGSTATVSWTAPAANGPPLDGYDVEVGPGGASCTPIPATATTCTVPSIPDGRYEVAVTASNAIGRGPTTHRAFTIDTVAPVVTAPVAVLRSGLSMSGRAVPVQVAWTATDPLAGIADTTLEVATGVGPYVDDPLVSATATSLWRTLRAGATGYRFRDRALDANGNVSGWATGRASTVTLRQETGTGIVYRGTWASKASSSALGGRLRVSSSRGASVSYTFTGRGVSFVTRQSNSSGKVAIYLDGVRVRTLDLYAGSTMVRWVGYVKMYATSGKHVLKIVNLATAGRPRMYVDGFATIK